MPAIHDAHATMFGLARHSELYERWAGRLAGRLYARVTADLLNAALPSGARILDVGTGPGLLPLRIAAACPQWTIDAVDLSPQMIDRARQSAAAAGQAEAVTFTVADVAALPFPAATFDLVVSTISQHHWSDPGAGLRELNRVLRPGAQAWIYDFRLALRRAQTAARTASPPPLISRQSPLEGTSQFNPIGRLVLQTAPPPLAEGPSERPDTPSR
jgi:ubiquinone/menaquinone biosynthesis C-methylase UbiE